MQLGPDQRGKFIKVLVVDIQCNKVSVQSVKAGQICALKVDLGKNGRSDWIKNCGGNEDLKGKVLVDEKTEPKASWTFLAELWNVKDLSQEAVQQSKLPSIVMKNSFRPCIHTLQIRQSAKVILDKRHCLA